MAHHLNFQNDRTTTSVDLSIENLRNFWLRTGGEQIERDIKRASPSYRRKLIELAKVLKQTSSQGTWNRNVGTVTIPWNNQTFGKQTVDKQIITVPMLPGLKDINEHSTSNKTNLPSKGTTKKSTAPRKKSTTSTPLASEPKVYYTPVHGPVDENGNLIPIRTGDNRLVEIGPTTENLEETVLYTVPLTEEQVEIPASLLRLYGIPLSALEFNFYSPQTLDFDNVYQALRSLGYSRRTARNMMKNPNFWSLIINLNQERYNQLMEESRPQISNDRLQLILADFRNASNRFSSYQKGGKMTDEQIEQAFYIFLTEVFGTEDKAELQKYVKLLGEEGLQQLYTEKFPKWMELKKLEGMRVARHGAKLNYIKQLKHQCAEDEELVYFKKGGIIGCGCKKKELGGQITKKKTAVEEFKAMKAQKDNGKTVSNGKLDPKKTKVLPGGKYPENWSAKDKGDWEKLYGKNDEGSAVVKNKGVEKNEKGNKFQKKGSVKVVGCGSKMKK